MNELESLQATLKSFGKVAIAYSGGCDSNFLMNVALETLGYENVLCVVCIGAMMSKEDIDNAKNLLKNVQHTEVEMDVFSIAEFKNNDRRRCYYCKKQVMATVINEATKQGYEYVLDGKNLDDEGEYRPGLQACQELGIISPLAMAGLHKKEIREYSRQMGVVTHDKPANACLASRFNYGTILTKENLDRVDRAEALFHQEGIYHVRVRVQDELARIEVEKPDFDKVYRNDQLIRNLKKLGFKYVTLDLNGITSGSYD